MPDQSLIDWMARKALQQAGKMRDYVQAEASLVLEGPLDDQAVAVRSAHCMGCPSRRESPADPIGFCDACGCGSNPRARLTVKLRMPAAKCPKKLW